MDTPSVSKTLKQIDPVWKQLRFGRVYTLIYLIVILFSFYERIMDIRGKDKVSVSSMETSLLSLFY